MFFPRTQKQTRQQSSLQATDLSAPFWGYSLRRSGTMTFSAICLLFAATLGLSALQEETDQTTSDTLASDTLASDTLAFGAQCLQTDRIKSYRVISNTTVEFQMQDETYFLATLAPTCPQLKFHQYFSFIPVDGTLCAGRDTLYARSGETCMMETIDISPTSSLKEN